MPPAAPWAAPKDDEDAAAEPKWADPGKPPPEVGATDPKPKEFAPAPETPPPSRLFEEAPN